MQYRYHDGLLEQVRLDVAARSVELCFFLYAVFDRPQARVAIRFERIVNFPAVQAYFANVQRDAAAEMDDCLDRCEVLQRDTKRPSSAMAQHLFLQLSHYGRLKIHCESVVEELVPEP